MLQKTFIRIRARWLALALISATTLGAQDSTPTDHNGMGPMNGSGMFLMDLGAGTSAHPASWPMPMIVLHYGPWTTSFMGTGYVMDTQQSGPRGGDKLYGPNWFMTTAQRRLGAKGTLQADLMLSLDAATITDRKYPLLFQTGETAYGVPIADGQHPHNLIMELGFHYTVQLGEGTYVDAYAAPVGDPALGPEAYPHRPSAAELPEATLSHHLQDSTHVSYDVVTLGVTHRIPLGKIKLEASGFHGGEPGENRWTIEQGSVDSWSGRLWWLPSANWAAQVSMGRLAHPEMLEPGDQIRTTASLHYVRPMLGSSWSSSLIWGRAHNTASQRNLNSYLVESVAPVRKGNFITGRIERVDKDELFSAQPVLEEQLDRIAGSTFRIGAYTLGYTRDVHLLRCLETGIGANFSLYSLPAAIKPYYGDRPVGANVFVRLRLKSAS